VKNKSIVSSKKAGSEFFCILVGHHVSEPVENKLFCEIPQHLWEINSKGGIDPKEASDGSGSKIFDPSRVRSIFCGSGWVRSAIYGLGLNLENFP